MRKLFFSVICLLLTMAVEAQTNFREITFDQAAAAAKSEGKLVFIDVMTSWCGPCKMMARDVFPQKKVGDFMNEKFVCLKIDAEKGEGIQIAKTYKVTAYPTFLLLNPDKSEVGRMVGGKQPDGFIAEIERLLDPNSTPEKMKERYEGGERSADLIKKYAGFLIEDAYNSRSGRDQKIAEARKIVTDYYAGLSDADRLKADNMFVYREYTQSTEDEAAKFMMANMKKFPAEVKEDIKKIVGDLFQRDVYSVLSGSMKATKESMDVFKKNLKQLGFNKNGSYDSSVKLMEAYAGDGDQYLQLCRELYADLGETGKAGLFEGLSTKFGNSDETTKKKASRFIREQLLDMDTNLLYTALMNIMTLESKGH
jgi:thiol-disulfide isomerase/thioredoxin